LTEDTGVKLDFIEEGIEGGVTHFDGYRGGVVAGPTRRERGGNSASRDGTLIRADEEQSDSELGARPGEARPGVGVILLLVLGEEGLGEDEISIPPSATECWWRDESSIFPSPTLLNSDPSDRAPQRNRSGGVGDTTPPWSVGEIHAELLTGEEIHSKLNSDNGSAGNTQSYNGKYE